MGAPLDSSSDRITVLLAAIRSSARPGIRWDRHLIQATLGALRRLLPIRTADQKPIPFKDLHKSAVLLQELRRNLPAELCANTRLLGILRILRYAGAFVDEGCNPIKSIHDVPFALIEDTEALKNGLIRQVVLRAYKSEMNLSRADAKPLTIIIFGKGRPDFLELCARVEAEIVAAIS